MVLAVGTEQETGILILPRNILARTRRMRGQEISTSPLATWTLPVRKASQCHSGTWIRVSEAATASHCSSGMEQPTTTSLPLRAATQQTAGNGTPFKPSVHNT